jgi:hypothetical protein
VQACSKLLIPSDRLVLFLQRCYGCYDDRGNTGGRESRRRSFSLAAVLGAIPAVAWAGVTVEGLGRLPGTKVELMRGLARTEMQRGDRTTAGQRARCGGARQRWRWSSMAAAGLRVRVPGRGKPFCRAAGHP